MPVTNPVDDFFIHPIRYRVPLFSYCFLRKKTPYGIIECSYLFITIRRYFIIPQKFLTFSNYSFDSSNSSTVHTDDGIHHYCALNRSLKKCPYCHSTDLIANGYKTKIIKHFTDALWKHFYHLKIPKYKCKNCNSSIMQRNPFCFKDCVYSIETIMAIRNELIDLSSTFTTVAKNFHISKVECMRLFDRFTADPKINYLPTVLSFDEKFLNRDIAENGYSFVLVDWTNKKLLDLVSSRHFDKLSSYFSKIDKNLRLKVKYITMDMYNTYLELAKEYFTNAIVAVDSFHVLQNLANAFDKVRLKHLRKNDNGAEDIDNNTDNYYLLKKSKEALLKNYGSLDSIKKYNHHFKRYVSEWEMVNMITKEIPELKKAYDLVQLYLDFNRCSSRKEASKEIDALIEDFNDSKISSFEVFAGTLSTWKEYILNSFTTIKTEGDKKRRLSEGPIESINSRIEKIHYNGNGYKKFYILRKICIYKINKGLPLRGTNK